MEIGSETFRASVKDVTLGSLGAAAGKSSLMAGDKSRV